MIQPLLLNNSITIICTSLVLYRFYVLYLRYFHVNRHTDHIDLVKRYVEVETIRKKRAKNG